MTTPTLVNTASPVHHTDTADTPWDGAASEKNLPSPMTLAVAKAAYAWYDAEQVDGGEIVKAGCKLPHHEVSADGTPGAANLPGVRNALSRLPQSDIPDAEQDAVRNHLQAHLDDEEAEEGEPADAAGHRPHASSRRPTLLATRHRPGMRLPPAGPTVSRPPRLRIVDQTNDGPAELWLYDAIGEDFFGFGINAEALCRDIAELAADEILLRVNSPGGDYFDGIAIYNALVQHPAQVVAQVDGFAASAASFIIQAANRVVMGRGARVMIHDALGVCVGNAADMQAMQDTLDSISADIADLYHAHAGGGPKTWRDRMRAETWYSADEAVTAGLADEVIPAPSRRGQDQGQAAAMADWSAAAVWDLSALRASEPSGDPAAEPGRQRIVAYAPPTTTTTATAAPVTVTCQAPPGAVDELADLLRAALRAAAVPPPAPAPSGAPTPDGVGTHPAADAAGGVAAAPAFPGSRATTDPVAAEADGDWSALVAGLNEPDPHRAVDDLLAHLRGDST